MLFLTLRQGNCPDPIKSGTRWEKREGESLLMGTCPVCELDVESGEGVHYGDGQGNYYHEICAFSYSTFCQIYEVIEELRSDGFMKEIDIQRMKETLEQRTDLETLMNGLGNDRT